jgi:ABC-type lipoprotein release transport system permease subunit
MPMRHFLDISQTGLTSVFLHPLRSLASVAAVVAVLLPYLAGLGLSKGIEDEAEQSARFGVDLYVAGSQFGRPTPLPLEAADAVRRIDGVTEVVPRIVGEILLGKEREHAVVVGLPPEHFAGYGDCVEGDLPRAGAGPNELVLGSVLARRLGLKVGDTLPPFYHSERGDRLSRVVGVFKPDGPLWQSNLVLTTFDTTADVFDQRGLATDLLVSCRPGYQAAVSHAIEQDLSFPVEGRGAVRARVTAREDLLALLPQGLSHREGIFNLHFLLAFAAGVLVLLVTSGAGLAERRREVGVLKAVGWQTDEVLLRALAESLALSLAAACLSLLAAWVWLRVFNGYGVAGLFLEGVGVAPDAPVPFRLTPVPVLLAFVLASAVVLTGTLYSAWRAATAPPREAMR